MHPFVIAILSLMVGIVLGLVISDHRRKVTEYVDDNTRCEVEEILYRAGAVKSEVTDAMVGFRKARIVFFKQAE